MHTHTNYRYIYIEKIENMEKSKISKISKKSDIFDIFNIFENITILYNPDTHLTV